MTSRARSRAAAHQPQQGPPGRPAAKSEKENTTQAGRFLVGRYCSPLTGQASVAACLPPLPDDCSVSEFLWERLLLLLLAFLFYSYVLAFCLLVIKNFAYPWNN